MTVRWQHHDSGLFSLEVPTGWSADVQPTGAVVVRDRNQDLTLTLEAVCKMPRESGGAMPAHPVTPRQVQAELEEAARGFKQVKLSGPPRRVPEAAHLTSTAEGEEHVRAGVSWWRRLLGRGPVVQWRFWAVMNEHLMVLARTSAAPAVYTEHRATLERIVASVVLPERDLLVGRPFTEVVVTLARGYFPRTQVAMIDDVHLRFGTCQVDLVPLHRRYLEAPDELSKHVRSYFSEVQRLNDSVAGATEWEDVRDEILPVLVEAEKVGCFGGDCVYQEWINGLHVVYVVDENGACRAVTREEAEAWLVDVDELHERAVENLVGRSSELTMEVSRAEGYVMLALATPDPYNASRILLPSLNRTLREHLGQTFFVAIPSREFLLAFSTDREDVLARVRKQIVADYRRMANPVSAKLFLVTPDGVAGDPDEPDEFVL